MHEEEKRASELVRLLSKPMVIAVAITIAYLATMLVLFLFPLAGVFEPKLLLPILNTTFAGALPIVVSIIAIRSYLTGGLNSLLLMGCGLMTFGSAAILAGWLMVDSQGPNVNVTIYNVGALLGSVLHVSGVVLVLRNETPETSQGRKRSKLIGACSVIFLFMLGLTLASLHGAVPLFFVQGTGPTLLRQWVLGSAAMLYFLSAVFLFKLFKREQRPFYYWYALSLIMIALGLVAAFIQPSVGSPMGWLNRVGHYMAGIYAMTAIWATSIYAHNKGVPFNVEMSALFRHAQMSYEVLVETVTEPIVTTDQDFRIIQWNSAAERKFGYSQDEALGRSLLDLVLTPSSSEMFQSSASQIAKASFERPSIGSLIEIAGKGKDSGPLALEVSLSGMRVKERLLFVSVFRDSTTRKAAEEAERKQADALLQASEVRYHSVVSALSEAVVTHGRDGSITSWNAAAERILGLSREQFQGRATLDPRWQIIHADGSTFLSDTRPSQVVFRTGASQLNVVMGIYKPDGALTWALINAVPIFDYMDPTPSSVVVTFSDITERKLAEAELQQHRQNLEQLVLSRTDELTCAKAEADAANQAKSDFLSNVSHELRTPLNAVVGLTRLLADSPLNRRQRDYAKNIQLSAQVLLALVNDVLDFSKIEANELHLEQAPFSLKTLMRMLASVLGVGVGSKPIEALLQIDPDVPDAWVGDVLRLQQILLNLVSNAVKFTHEGEIVVSVRCLCGPNTLAGAQATLQISVRDTGIGMATASLSSIFDSFTQASTSTSRLYGGTGLGLAISAQLAKLMGGHIGVESTLDQGSEFRLEVPLTLGHESTSPASVEIPVNLCVLIVEDHPLAREVLAQTCTALGWQAHVVASGEAGLQALLRNATEKREYDLLLLDWHMPAMDGLEMLRQADAMPSIYLPWVVLMAPLTEMEQAVTASAGIKLDVAAKPLTPDSLVEVVSRAFSNKLEKNQPLEHRKTQSLAGMRLLVAEDNLLSQEVVAQMLSRAGAEVVLVGDGLAVLAALKRPGEHFDVVLMDIQMPLMDGYSVIRHIRDELGMLDLPIIAVTAFARPEDREKSRMAGMVGHLVKPLDVEKLLDIVASIRSRGARRA